ncbi:rhodanese-like domain-containing protein [Lutibacter holmesii]|uniref:Rhodanese-like domain-containing protein n=1 Tax=Lutibacter holmesii TaxID=1137985 RepID=A0ABW3WQ94_9FLAO
MKELEKTKRISIASVLFILVILIGLVTYKRPKHVYSITPQVATENIVANNFLISLDELTSDNIAIVDIRSPFEFQKGHLENAKNIPASEVLNDDNITYFYNLKGKNTTVVLYGTNPDEALAPYMVLYQLGYNNLKILTIENSYNQNKLITTSIELEKSNVDIKAFIAESIKKSNVVSKPKPVIKKTPKKVIPKKKKKKMPTEGGC